MTTNIMSVITLYGVRCVTLPERTCFHTLIGCGHYGCLPLAALCFMGKLFYVLKHMLKQSKFK